jgi:hypothetical protein
VRGTVHGVVAPDLEVWGWSREAFRARCRMRCCARGIGSREAGVSIVWGNAIDRPPSTHNSSRAHGIGADTSEVGHERVERKASPDVGGTTDDIHALTDLCDRYREGGLHEPRFPLLHFALGDVAGEVRVVWSGLCLAFAVTSPVAIALALGAQPLLAVFHVHGSALAAGAWALRVAGVTFVIRQLVGVVNTAQQVRLRWRQTPWSTLSRALLALSACHWRYTFSLAALWQPPRSGCWHRCSASSGCRGTGRGCSQPYATA